MAPGGLFSLVTAGEDDGATDQVNPGREMGVGVGHSRGHSDEAGFLTSISTVGDTIDGGMGQACTMVVEG